MATILQFPRRSPVLCSEVTQPQADAAQAALFDVMGSCPDCTGRGWIFFKRADGRTGTVPCPCGGTDADRIELSEVSA